MYTIVTQSQAFASLFTAGGEPSDKRGRGPSTILWNKLVSLLFFLKVSVDQFS
jgi:hypothetical protein